MQSLWFYVLRIDDVSEVIKVDNSSVAKGHNVQVLADGFDDCAAGLSHGSNNGLAVIGENGVEGRIKLFHAYYPSFRLFGDSVPIIGKGAGFAANGRAIQSYPIGGDVEPCAVGNAVESIITAHNKRILGNAPAEQAARTAQTVTGAVIGNGNPLAVNDKACFSVISAVDCGNEGQASLFFIRL